MHFHPQKCKAISVNNRSSPLLGVLPNIQYYYSLGNVTLSFVDSEKDLGVHINKKINFDDQCCKLLSKANKQFGLTKRTCHFVKDSRRRRVLYLTLIRSQFEHCSPVWRPYNDTAINKFESFQKSCLKWILSEGHISYSNYGDYLSKCRQANLLPMACKFDLNDLVLFHKVVYDLIPLSMPSYLKLFDGYTRLRSSHLDRLCYVSSLLPIENSTLLLNKSFFYRTHSLWNALPLDIREISLPSAFKELAIKHLWSNILSQENGDCLEDFRQSDIE